MRIIITENQYRKIIKEQSVVGAPNYGMQSNNGDDGINKAIKKIGDKAKNALNTISKNIKSNSKQLPYQTFTNEDTGVFKSILSGLGAPVTPETLGFMYAWRECESSLGSEEKFYCNNPFNTTWDTDPKGSRKAGILPGSPESTMYSRTNSHGVKSYKTIQYGITATISTINKNYSEIITALQENSSNISLIIKNCSQPFRSGKLGGWGTEYKCLKQRISSYLNGETPQPRPINRGTGCY